MQLLIGHGQVPTIMPEASELFMKNATVKHAHSPMWEKGGNHLCLAQKHTENISCILSMAIARPSYALLL